MRRLLAAIRFLTVLPIPGTWGTAEQDLAGSVPMFPVVGLLLGAATAGFAWAMSQVAPPMVTAAAVVVAMVAHSGGLHMDGLSDTIDGFLSSRPRERILDIMKDSHVGAMGAIAIVAVMLMKFASLASLCADLLVPAAFLMPLAGRCGMVIQMGLLRYVRPTGLGSVFARRWPRTSTAGSVMVLAATGYALLGLHGLTVAGLCVATSLAMAGWCYRKIGGSTGDTYGATCEIVELVPAAALTIWPLSAVR